MAHPVDRTKETAITETFTPVDGGLNRACRGASSGDNHDAYFTLQSAPDLTGCKRLCEETAGCKGIEYHTSGRCEVWIRPDGIGASTWVALLYLTLLPLPMKLAGFVPLADFTKSHCLWVSSKGLWALRGTSLHSLVLWNAAEAFDH